MEESRRFQRIEPKPEGEVKGIMVVIVCYFYAILLFFLAALFAKATASVKENVMEKFNRYEFWNYQREKKLQVTKIQTTKEEIYDVNQNIRSKKNMNHGAR